MKKQIKYFATFYAPGSFTADTWSKDINHPDPLYVEWPDNAYAFSLNMREDVVDGNDRYVGTVKQIGPMYYHPDSRVETLEEVRRNVNATSILIRNMESNKWDVMIWTRWGNWPQPFRKDEMVILGKRDGQPPH